MNSRIASAIAAVTFGAIGAASAQITVVQNETAFARVANGAVSLEDFNAEPVANLGVNQQVAIGDLMVELIRPDGAGGFLRLNPDGPVDGTNMLQMQLDGSPKGTLVLTFPQPITAFAADFASANLVNAGVHVFIGDDSPEFIARAGAPVFRGFIFDEPVSEIRIQDPFVSVSPLVIDNLRWSSMRIAEPAQGSIVDVGEEIAFELKTNAPDDVRWISNVDGTLGTEAAFSRDDLSEGVHQVTVTDGTATLEFTLLVIEPLRGEQGPQGEQGPAGADGADGADGAQGPQGPAGADGAQGPQGEQGPAGADGAQGERGPAGSDGADGAQGPQGEQGPAGPAGADGADGAQGPQGEQGPAGADGADGAQGPQGEQGPAGADGADGAQGAQGPQGEQGPAGVAGADGARGPQGEQGPAGVAGADGARGPQGEQGPAGVAGADGARGPQGEQGPAGPAGADGAQGPQGEQGPAGPQGERGPPGDGAGAAELDALRAQVECQRIVTVLRATDAMVVKVNAGGIRWIGLNGWIVNRVGIDARAARRCSQAVFGDDVSIFNLFGR